MKHIFLLLTLPLLLLTGCGYRIGKLGHPQVRTVAIPTVVNETVGYNVSAIMRNMLAEQFMFDGTMKVVSESKADCLIQVRILDIVRKEVTQSSYNDDDEIFVPDEWRVTITAEFTVVIPGRRDPLIPLRKVTGSAVFQAPGDMDANSRRGIQMACRALAQEMVEFTADAF